MPEHVDTLRDILGRLDAASSVEIWMFPPFHLHALKGGCNCQANWREIFRFEDGAALDVDYLDYH